jgi:hypothetical protein
MIKVHSEKLRFNHYGRKVCSCTTVSEETCPKMKFRAYVKFTWGLPFCILHLSFVYWSPFHVSLCSVKSVESIHSPSSPISLVFWPLTYTPFLYLFCSQDQHLLSCVLSFFLGESQLNPKNHHSAWVGRSRNDRNTK